MEKRLENIIELGTVYGWNLELQRDRQFNFRNENNDLIVIYWSAKKQEIYTITRKGLKEKPKTRQGCEMDIVESVFRSNSLFDFAELIKISPDTIDRFLKEFSHERAADLIGMFPDWYKKNKQ